MLGLDDYLVQKHSKHPTLVSDLRKYGTSLVASHHFSVNVSMFCCLIS
jgi:hypothetical protein